MSLINIHIVVPERSDAILFDPSAVIALAELPSANLTLFPNAEGQTVRQERGIGLARNVLYSLIFRTIPYFPNLSQLARSSAVLLTGQIKTLGS